MRILAFARLRSRFVARQIRNALLLPKTGLDEELRKAGPSFRAWLAQRRAGPRQYVELARARGLADLMPAQCHLTLAGAEAAVQHRFDLLGSGPFHSADPERPARADGYRPIDWYLDPVRDLRFPRGVPHKQWKLFEMRPGDADVKYPWELGRCQHWPTLGQAWRLTGDARFAHEVARQLDDFMEANPVGIGVNWTCTMDVGLRAANWCIALALLLDCPALDDAFWARAYGALFDHGRFIFENLENIYEVTSNHFLSNVVGLFYLAVEFRDLPQGQDWIRWCREALETEIDVQVLPDGADFESAVPYHRLVAELFLGSARLAALNGMPLSAHYTEVVARMVDYLLGVARPDGLMPVIGDADDGRLHVFTRYADWNRQDARHLLAPAGALLGRPDWLRHAGDEGRWEAAWWGFDPAALDCAAVPPPPLDRLFPEAGVAVARANGHYLAATNPIVGTRGFGNHKHNEQLSFEYHCAGRPVIVDPGSFVYTSDFAARNLFRSTAYHNTVVIDGAEQNEFNPEWLFRMFEKAEPEHLAFASTDAWTEYRGRHRGYMRLDRPVLHERRLRLHKDDGLLLIEDRLSGDGRHALSWHFHAAPGVAIAALAPGRWRLAGDGIAITLRADPVREGRVDEAWVSPSYGRRVPAAALTLPVEASMEGLLVQRFAFVPEGAEARFDPRWSAFAGEAA